MFRTPWQRSFQQVCNDCRFTCRTPASLVRNRHKKLQVSLGWFGFSACAVSKACPRKMATRCQVRDLIPDLACSFGEVPLDFCCLFDSFEEVPSMSLSTLFQRLYLAACSLKTAMKLESLQSSQMHIAWWPSEARRISTGTVTLYVLDVLLWMAVFSWCQRPWKT